MGYGTLSAGQRAAVLAVARPALATTASLTMVSQRCEPYGNRAASRPAVEVRERRRRHGWRWRRVPRRYRSRGCGVVGFCIPCLLRRTVTDVITSRARVPH